MNAIKDLKKSLLICLIISFLFLSALPVRACFTIVVGKGASADGCVLVAHNEDDGPPQVVNHKKGSQVVVGYSQDSKFSGVSVNQEIQNYIHSQMPNMDYSDSFLNQFGVCVTSNNCPSKEDKPEITGQGIGKEFRFNVATSAKNAREGVIYAGQLVEEKGYLDSGRTYIIADPCEAWIFLRRQRQTLGCSKGAG